MTPFVDLFKLCGSTVEWIPARGRIDRTLQRAHNRRRQPESPTGPFWLHHGVVHTLRYRFGLEFKPGHRQEPTSAPQVAVGARVAHEPLRIKAPRYQLWCDAHCVAVDLPEHAPWMPTWSLRIGLFHAPGNRVWLDPRSWPLLHTVFVQRPATMINQRPIYYDPCLVRAAHELTRKR